MKKYAVIGNPVLFSKSPDIYNYLFSQNSVNSHYSRIAAGKFEDAAKLYKLIKLDGANVTSPYKPNAFEFSNYRDALSEQIKAANTMLTVDDKVFGYNTDVFGVRASITAKGKRGSKILVIGAGSTAKAALLTLSSFKKIKLINRTHKKALDLSKQFNYQCEEWDKLGKAIEESDFIISTVPFSGVENVEELFGKTKAVVYDAIYQNSPLKEISEKVGFEYFSGIDWLIHQALQAFRIYTGIHTEYSKVASIFKKNAKTKSNIYLVGFSGAGKSKVAKLLANSLEMDLVDFDELIESKEGASINEIFSSKGEEYFRELENKMLSEHSSSKNTVFATGAGMVENQKNITSMKQNGKVVWLYSSLEVCLERLEQSNNRPLLKMPHPEVLYASRFDNYFKASDLIISSETEVDEIVNQLIFEFRNVRV